MNRVRWVEAGLLEFGVGINKPSKATAEYSNGGYYPGGVLATRHARKDFKL